MASKAKTRLRLGFFMRYVCISRPKQTDLAPRSFLAVWSSGLTAIAVPCDGDPLCRSGRPRGRDVRNFGARQRFDQAASYAIVSDLVLNHGLLRSLISAESLRREPSIDSQESEGACQGAGESNRGVFHGSPFRGLQRVLYIYTVPGAEASKSKRSLAACRCF